MKLFGWKGAATSRRSNRLWLLRLKRFGLAIACVCTLSGIFVYGWTSGFFSRAGQVVHDKTMAFTGSLGFNVNEILVSGRDNIPPEEILEHLGIEKGVPIFDVSLDATQEELEKISWVKTVSLSRRLPDKIHIDITEREPAALWQHNKKISAIDDSGKVLVGGALERYKNLPLIVGDGAPARVTQIIGLLQAEPVVSDTLASAVLIGARRWDLHLKNGIVVKLPEEDVEVALSRLANAAQSDNLFEKNITTIDLRLPERMVLGVKDTQIAKQEKNSI